MLHGKRIMVIDDDSDVRQVICENLRCAGYEVLDACNGAVGLEKILHNGSPDLVVTDINMPDMEGIETILNIRKIYPSVKVVAISGGRKSIERNFLSMAEKLGADASFQKPLDLDRFEDEINKLIAT